MNKPSTETAASTAGTSSALLGRCETCRYWCPAPTQVPGCPPEKICGKSREGGRGLHGQDGRPIITPADFGCVLYRPDPKRLFVSSEWLAPDHSHPHNAPLVESGRKGSGRK